MAASKEALSDDASKYYIGVDAGSGSVRAGLFTSEGLLLVHCKEDIKLWKNGVHSEQSSEDIWKAVVTVIKVHTCYKHCICECIQYTYKTSWLKRAV